MRLLQETSLTVQQVRNPPVKSKPTHIGSQALCVRGGSKRPGSATASRGSVKRKVDPLRASERTSISPFVAVTACRTAAKSTPCSEISAARNSLGRTRPG